MKILNHPEATVDDLISASMYYEANKKKIKAQRLGKDCYKYINNYKEFIPYKINQIKKIKVLNKILDNNSGVVNVSNDALINTN